MSRLLEEPRPVQVEMDTADTIARILWDDRTERVIETCNRYRVDDDWWHVPISRTYHQLITPTAMLMVFLNERTGEWFLERIVD